ncbi:hypothetical protein LGQ02_12590 [Bacillus shivajii]|uniref:hypothetical protein n=1 Tax=Bacillus shivajii TaxID=1983719 RepID=UPI001CFB39C3|nr:hypothetical protein [Bacillus shivajii]UCZ51702.1 hypothetical protein LGQ02_12590 [Bacillus shivajii]
MIHGKVKWFLQFALFSFVIVFLTSAFVNTLMTTVYRSVIALFIGGIFGIFMCWTWNQVLTNQITSKADHQSNNKKTERENVKEAPPENEDQPSSLDEDDIKKTSGYVKQLLND